VTVSVLLLICAAVLLRANNRIGQFDVGLQTRSRVAIKIQDKLRAKVVQRLASDPLVHGFAAASKLPFVGSLPWVPVVPHRSSERSWAQYIYVSPEYFSILGLPILRGRGFNADEAKGGAPVVVVSQTTAGQFWPERDPLGRSLRIEQDPQQPRSLAENLSIGIPLPRVVRGIGITRDA